MAVRTQDEELASLRASLDAALAEKATVEGQLEMERNLNKRLRAINGARGDDACHAHSCVPFVERVETTPAVARDTAELDELQRTRAALTESELQRSVLEVCVGFGRNTPSPHASSLTVLALAGEGAELDALAAYE